MEAVVAAMWGMMKITFMFCSIVGMVTGAVILLDLTLDTVRQWRR